MEFTIKKKCTVANIDCLETIVDHYNIENARPHITTYKSAVDEICVEFKDSVLELTTVSNPFKYESMMFVLGWQRTDDLTLNDINGLLQKVFGDMANNTSFKYGLKRKRIKNDNNMFSNLNNFITCIVYDVYYTTIYILYTTLSNFLVVEFVPGLHLLSPRLYCTVMLFDEYEQDVDLIDMSRRKQ